MNLLPDDPACSFIGFSKSPNLLLSLQAQHPAPLKIAAEISDPTESDTGIPSRQQIEIDEKNASVQRDADRLMETMLPAATTPHTQKILAEILNESDSIDAADLFRETLLHRAAGWGDKGLVELLLARGASIESRDRIGCTPLLRAVTQGQEEVAGLLIKRGASVEARDEDGWTPLLRAVENANVGIVLLLLENNVNTEAMRVNGSRPLHEASRCDHGTVVSLLLEGGANADAVDGNGKRPLDLASLHQSSNNIDLLSAAVSRSTDVNRQSSHSQPQQIPPRSSMSTSSTSRNKRYFIPGEGIDHDVITSDICLYLGNDALAHPGVLEVGSICFNHAL